MQLCFEDCKMSGHETTDPPVFRNPILQGFNPDPTICVVPATKDTPTRYFLSTSTFEYFPGCAIYTSTDLLDWRIIGHALNRRSQMELRTVEPGAGSWASTLRYRADEKRWYLANCLFQRYRPASDVCRSPCPNHSCVSERTPPAKNPGLTWCSRFRSAFSHVDSTFTPITSGMTMPGRIRSISIIQASTKM